MADEKRKHEDLELEERQLKLEEMRYRVQEMRDKQQARIAASQNQERSAEAKRQSETVRHAICYHKKGGMGVENFLRGDDSMYCVIQNTYPDNVTVVMCQRCGKEWKPGDKDYAAAMNWPSGNTPSSAATWNIPVKA